MSNVTLQANKTLHSNSTKWKVTDVQYPCILNPSFISIRHGTPSPLPHGSVQILELETFVKFEVSQSYISPGYKYLKRFQYTKPVVRCEIGVLTHRS